MAARAKKEVQIIIPEIKILTTEIRIVGTSPLVVHKFSEKARKMMLEKQMKTAKSNGKEAKNPVEDLSARFFTATYNVPP